eukprot:CAMPEP_0172464298 /NCGR_PEP_ID=MMETSP1065-20121228/50029_1 /TAXON_ID=265537 /ORGANISM="Amphiprora paludosa, Strain CCMP125" /LENGTH=51 /DNA_ID=CAMNT_0013220489 /DNA_START=14 /DNA_END=165 /DNA_ORIENTATION=-
MMFLRNLFFTTFHSLLPSDAHLSLHESLDVDVEWSPASLGSANIMASTATG